MSITVTATPTGAAGALLRVLVLTGAVESGGNKAIPTGNTSGHVSFTPTFSHSFVAWSLNDAGAATTFIANTNNTLLDSIGTSGQELGSGYYGILSATAAGTAVTIGATTGANPTTLAAYEIPPSVAGVTPVIDASSPVLVDETSGSAALTTASFNPPASAVVAAIVSGSSFPSAWTVSDSSSMTWTKRADNTNGQQIWTATTPSGGAAFIAPVPRLINQTITRAAYF
jgi:hypothetical protein